MTMCGEFAALGLRTLLVVPGGQALSLEALRHDGDLYSFYSVRKPFDVKYFPNGLGGRLSYLAFAYSLLLVAYVRARGYALITTRNVEVAMWAVWLGVPVILESHNFAKFAANRWIQEWIRAMRDPRSRTSMVVTTRAGRDAYLERGVPAQLIKVLPNGVALDRYDVSIHPQELRRELGLPISKSLVGFSGSLREGRGGEEMVDCARRLPEVHFLIVGGSSGEVAHLKQLACKDNLTNVTLTGHVPQEIVPRYLLAADILLMPYTTRFREHSFQYTSPMKMFEYLATGRPIVATDFPILHEVLEDGRNAVFVEPDSGEALARGIRLLLDNPERARRIGENAKATSRNYSWERRAGEIVDWQCELGNLRRGAA